MVAGRCRRVRFGLMDINTSLMVLTVLLPWSAFGLSTGFIQGSVINCDNEGQEVQIPWISNDPCITCSCQKKEVVCRKETCPDGKGCYFLLYGGEKKTCCEVCKGCNLNGKKYSDGEEWGDTLDACKRYVCQAGVSTESKIYCYTSCRNPKPPFPGQCCPTCEGCDVDGIKYPEGSVIPLSLSDPCIRCKCKNGSTLCTKTSCPVLPCQPSRFVQKPGACCPECRGNRKVFDLNKKCLLGMHAFRDGETLTYDSCTKCTCSNSTSVCMRISCPPLECWPEQQIRDPEQCCPKCRGPEEKKAVCISQGKMYESGEKWKMERCTSCSCQNGEVRCSALQCDNHITCPPRQILKTLPNECCPVCVEDDGVCTVFGDPHYRTFDGRIFNYQGSCKYVLVRECHSKSFSVEVLNDSRYSKAFSWTKSVTLKVDGTKVRLGQYQKVQVDRKPVRLPHVVLGVLSIVQEGFSIVIRTNLGIKVLWDGDSFLEVSAPTQYKEKLCGLCGNYNGNPNDDFVTRKGNVVYNSEDFGNSWRVGHMKRCSRPYLVHGESSCQRNWEARIRAIRECNVLKSAIFRPCHRVISALPYYRSCLLDSCECRARDRCYCESLNAYARECGRTGIVLDWRNATNCEGGHCPKGEVFMPCAPACRRTCKKPNRSNCQRRCRPGCYCPAGTVWHQRRCIPFDECPT